MIMCLITRYSNNLYSIYVYNPHASKGFMYCNAYSATYFVFDPVRTHYTLNQLLIYMTICC